MMRRSSLLCLLLYGLVAGACISTPPAAVPAPHPDPRSGTSVLDVRTIVIGTDGIAVREAVQALRARGYDILNLTPLTSPLFDQSDLMSLRSISAARLSHIAYQTGAEVAVTVEVETDRGWVRVVVSGYDSETIELLWTASALSIGIVKEADRARVITSLVHRAIIDAISVSPQVNSSGAPSKSEQKNS